MATPPRTTLLSATLLPRSGLVQSVVAYYRPGFDRDYIVMSHAGVEAFPVAVHEYFHLIVQHAKMTLPPWLEEGLAELYSTLRPIGGKITVGTTIPTRHRALLQDPWVPRSNRCSGSQLRLLQRQKQDEQPL